MKRLDGFFKLMMLLVVLSLFFSSCDKVGVNPGDDSSGLSKGDTVLVFQLDEPGFKINDVPLAKGNDGSIYFEAVPFEVEEMTRVYALSSDGKLKWKTEGLSEFYISNNIVVGDNGTLYCTSGMFLFAINPENGTINWTWECPRKLKLGNIEWDAYLPLSGLTLTNNGDLVFQTSGTLNGVLEAMFCVDEQGNEKWHSLRQNSGSNQITVGPDGMIYSYGHPWDENGYYQPEGLIVTNPDNGAIEKYLQGSAVNVLVYPVFTSNNNLVVPLYDTVKCLNLNDYTLKWEFVLNGPIQFPNNLLTDNNGNTFITPPFYKISDNETGLIESPESLVIPWYSVIDNNSNLTGMESYAHPSLISVNDKGEELWKKQEYYLGNSARSVMLSDDVLYFSTTYENNNGNSVSEIIALQWDASMIQTGWPRISHDNRNTCNFNKW